MAGLSARWVQQVLRDRGIDPPSPAIIDSYVSQLDPQELASADRVVRAIRFGTDQPGQIEGLLDRMKRAASQSFERDSPEPDGDDAQRHAIEVPAPEASDRARLRAHGFHVYAKSCAMKVEIDTIRGDEPLRHTVAIEIAPAATAARAYNWQQKIPFQFTLRELPTLAAVLLGYSAGPLMLANHGPSHDKRFALHDQGPNMFVKVLQGRTALALPIDAADTRAWAALCLIALRWNTPQLDTHAHLALLRRLAQMRDATVRS